MKAKLSAIALGFVSCCSILAFAGNQEQSVHFLHSNSGAKVISLSIDKSSAGDEKIRLILNGEEMNFDMSELSDGDVQEFTTADGKTIKIIKATAGSMVTIDGEDINLSHFGDFGGHMAKVFALGGLHHKNSITISGGDLDEDTRARIKDAIMAAGVDKKVHFASSGHFSWSSGDLENLDIVIDAKNGVDGNNVFIFKKHIEIKSEEKED